MYEFVAKPRGGRAKGYRALRNKGFRLLQVAPLRRREAEIPFPAGLRRAASFDIAKWCRTGRIAS